MPEEDASYKQATKAVDDAMRMDVLGSKVLDVVEKYHPVRNEINSIIDERLTQRKGEGVSRIIWEVVGAAVVAAVSLGIGVWIKK